MEGIEEAVYWHTVGIVTYCAPRGEAQVDCGTGTGIKWNGRTYLATAHHVVCGKSADQIGFFFRPSGTLERKAKIRIPVLRTAAYSNQQNHQLQGNRHLALRSAVLARGFKKHSILRSILPSTIPTKISINYSDDWIPERQRSADWQ